MDEQTNLLRELLQIQREQNALLKKHLLRLKFSLFTLLMLMTLVAIGLSVVGYQVNAVYQWYYEEDDPTNPFAS